MDKFLVVKRRGAGKATVRAIVGFSASHVKALPNNSRTSHIQRMVRALKTSAVGLEILADDVLPLRLGSARRNKGSAGRPAITISRPPGDIDRSRRALAMKTAVVDRIVWCFRNYDYANSLAHVSRCFATGLYEAGYRVSLYPLDTGDTGRPGHPTPQLDLPIATDLDLRTAAVLVMGRGAIPMEVKHRLDKAPFLGAYYMVEGDRLKEFQVNKMNGYDAVFVPTVFSRNALVRSGVTSPVFEWGCGFYPDVFPYVEPNPFRPFTYLWFGDPIPRKGFDLFMAAFSRISRPDVRAWVHAVHRPSISLAKKSYGKDPRIVWDIGVTPPERIGSIMKEADVAVFPYRGEGFCLTMLEAMASGRPAVATRWSAPLAFGGGDDLTFWVNVAGWEPAVNDAGVQAVPDMDDLVAKMEYCADHPEEVKHRGIAASALAHGAWRWDQKVPDVIPVLKKFLPKFDALRDLPVRLGDSSGSSEGALDAEARVADWRQGPGGDGTQRAEAAPAPAPDGSPSGGLAPVA